MRLVIQKIRRLDYGWWVAIAGMSNMVVTSGPTFQGASVLFAAIEAEFGWSIALVSGVPPLAVWGAPSQARFKDSWPTG